MAREFNPILIKELRTVTREPRFLFMHMLVVLAVAVVSIAMASTAEREYLAGWQGYDATRQGQALFSDLQSALIVAVVILVPGFAATIITSEKDRKTFELMISCSIGPLQIVWGKFLSTMVMVAVSLGSTLPFLALSFLFGGVSPIHVIGFSTVLALFAALLCSSVIYISSTFESSTWATLWAYVAAFFIGLCFVGFLNVMKGIPVVREFYGMIVSEQEDRGGRSSHGVIGPFLAGWLVPVCVAAWLTAYLFTSTAVMLDRLPVYRLGRPQALFRWIQERGLAVLAVVSIVSFIIACMGA